VWACGHLWASRLLYLRGPAPPLPLSGPSLAPLPPSSHSPARLPLASRSFFLPSLPYNTFSVIPPLVYNIPKSWLSSHPAASSVRSANRVGPPPYTHHSPRSLARETQRPPFPTPTPLISLLPNNRHFLNVRHRDLYRFTEIVQARTSTPRDPFGTPSTDPSVVLSTRRFTGQRMLPSRVSLPQHHRSARGRLGVRRPSSTLCLPWEPLARGGEGPHPRPTFRLALHANQPWPPPASGQVNNRLTARSLVFGPVLYAMDSGQAQLYASPSFLQPRPLALLTNDIDGNRSRHPRSPSTRTTTDSGGTSHRPDHRPSSP